MELISAKNRFAIDASLEQLSGKIKNRIQDLRSTLLDEIAYIEAALDDPEHISLEGYTEGLTERVQKIRAAVRRWQTPLIMERFYRGDSHCDCRKAKCRKVIFAQCVIRKTEGNCHRDCRYDERYS